MKWINNWFVKNNRNGWDLINKSTDVLVNRKWQPIDVQRWKCPKVFKVFGMKNVNLGIRVDTEKYLMLPEKRGNLTWFLFCLSSIAQGHYLLIFQTWCCHEWEHTMFEVNYCMTICQPARHLLSKSQSK